MIFPVSFELLNELHILQMSHTALYYSAYKLMLYTGKFKLFFCINLEDQQKSNIDLDATNLFIINDSTHHVCSLFNLTCYIDLSLFSYSNLD